MKFFGNRKKRISNLDGGVFMVEFLPDCSCVRYSGAVFPYLQGFLKSREIPVHWVYIARNDEYSGAENIIDPPLSHVDAVISEAKRLRASVVVINQTCSDSFLTVLKEQLPDCHIVIYGSGNSSTSAGNVYSVGYFENLLGISIRPNWKRLFFAAKPDFAATNLLGIPITLVPIMEPFLLDSSCYHHASIAANPSFANVDLSDVQQTVGCSFCLGVVQSGSVLNKSKRVAQLKEELISYSRTAPEERKSAFFSIQDVALFPEVFQLALTLPIGPTTFYFVRRIDEILRAEQALRKCLPEFARLGHRIVFDCVGVENFSTSENQRFNKCISSDEIERFFLTMFELEKRWPQALRFIQGYELDHKTDHESHGFTMILFSPWTTIEDLLINLDAFDRLAKTIEPFGNLRHQLTSRLKLLPGTAITKLAEQNGLVETEFPEPVLDITVNQPSTGAYDEIPWRFANPEVATIHRFAIRVFRKATVKRARPIATESLLDDGMAEIRRQIEDGMPFQHFFRTLVEVVQRAPEASDAEILRCLTTAYAPCLPGRHV